MRFRELRVTALMIGVAATSTTAQSASTIGEFLIPWGASVTTPGNVIQMTVDGETILIQDAAPGGCWVSFAKQRLAVINSDGTGYRIVVDWDEMMDLWPDGTTFVHTLTMSGDGSRAAFAWPGKWDVTYCEALASHEWNLVDMASGEVTPFRFNNAPVGSVSFSDDGTKMAFQGWDPEAQDWAYYLAEPDGSGAAHLLDTTPWCGSFGVLSGDGNKLLIAAVNDCFCPCENDILLYDIPSGTTVKLNPTPADTVGFSLSYDGSRVAYSDGDGSIIGVNGDGTNPHVIATESGGGQTTVSRDGEFVFYRTVVGNSTPIHRSRFDGTEPTRLPGLQSGASFRPVPVNADGSLYAYYDKAVIHNLPPGVWFEHTPMLTTYGFGAPGTPMTWDIGGEQGDTYFLALSLDALTPGAGTQFGRLELDPASLIVIDSGTISGEQNIGSKTIDLRPSLGIPDALPLHFQALVMSRETGEGKLTNRTTVVFQDAPTSTASAPLSGPGSAVVAPSPHTTTHASEHAAHGGFVPLTPQERLKRWALLDPKVGTWYFGEN